MATRKPKCTCGSKKPAGTHFSICPVRETTTDKPKPKTYPMTRSDGTTVRVTAPEDDPAERNALALTDREREHIATMVDFFRASGEDQHLDSEVLDALARKMGVSVPAKEDPLRPSAFVAFRQGTNILNETLKEALELADHVNGEEDSVAREIANGLAAAIGAFERYEDDYELRRKERRPDGDGDEPPLIAAAIQAYRTIDEMLGEDGYEATTADDCECDEHVPAEGEKCAHTHARFVQERLQDALNSIGYVKDNFGAWGFA